MEAETTILETDRVFKSYMPADVEVKGDEIVAVVSKDTVDADGEVVIPKNIDLERFRRVRGIYFDHGMEYGHPIGKALWIKASCGELISKYLLTDATEMSRTVKALVKDGVYRMHSIGVYAKSRTVSRPTTEELRARPDWAKAIKGIWRGNPLMLEFSVVKQPAHDECAVIAIGKSLGISQPVIDIISGRATATRQAAQSIISHVKSGKDVKNAIAITLAEINARFDPDAAIKSALQKLR